MTPGLDFDHFHRALDVAPTQRLALPHVAGLAPFAFALDDGRAYTFTPTVDRIAIKSGHEGASTIMRLREEHWSNFVTERFTRYGVLYNSNPQFELGDFADLCRWEPALRALFHGRPVYDPHLPLRDRNGRPLDTGHTFTLDDDPAELSHFLQTAGFLHVRDVFDAGEVDGLRAELDRLVSLARPDEVHSWWTRTPGGDPVVCQIKYGARASQVVTDLHSDPRILALVEASGEAGLLPNLDRNEGTKIIVKRPGASEGLTDLPLHTDCGMGFHPIACQMVLIGIHLDAGDEQTGQLHFAPGSHCSTAPDAAIVGCEGWPIVKASVEAGDCTVHYSHTLHGAPPPAGDPALVQSGRRTIYPCFAPPSLFDALAPYEDLVAIMQKADGVTTTVDERLGAQG